MKPEQLEQQQLYEAEPVAKGWRRTLGARLPMELRFFAKVTESDSGCWQWIGATNTKGYGHIRAGGNMPVMSAHRWSWEFFNGPIPTGLEVDHLCFNRSCVNPDHLDVVTRYVNVHRGRINQNDGSTSCKWGHEFSSANTGTDVRGNRVCRACSRDRTRQYRMNRSAA